MRQWHLVQVCNVGTVVGGTGACAWTVTRALPDWRHTILFLSRITPETHAVSPGIQLQQISRVTESLLKKLAPDIVLYHNTRRAQVDDDCWQRPSLYYQHSQVKLWESMETVACSKWLADQHPELSRPQVLYQAVPRPSKRDSMRATHEMMSPPLARGSLFFKGENALSRPQERATCSSRRSRLGNELTVGRICTPTAHKWPRELIPFYQTLAKEHPRIDWEFVGCPTELQADLQRAVNDRARFHAAGWSARSHFWNWDVSLYHHPTVTETFGRTVAEGMRTGCIPVIDDRGGFQEQLEDHSGFLCSTVNEFSAALTALADPGERIARSRRCRAFADENFSLTTFRERLLSKFREVVAVHV